MPILVLDDDAVTRLFHTKVLCRAGHEVDTGEDGDAGWKALLAKRYDLLITDNDMPKMSGVELIQKLRSEGMALPVILATGSPPTNAETLQLAAVLLKPFSSDQLLQTVKKVLHGPQPDSATPKMKTLARKLLAYEAATGRPPGAKDPVTFRVLAKLRGPLGQIMGAGGFHSLLARALALAGAEVPWLRALSIRADGSLEGLGELGAKLGARALTEGQVVLVSQLLGLLVIFIGSALTLGLLQDIWPKADDLVL